jgi:predicted RND superfamily exporter protein
MTTHQIEADDAGSGFLARLIRHIEARPAATVWAALALTLLLVIPLLLLPPDSTASSDPAGEVFDVQDTVDDRFESSLFIPPYIVEARDGDLLTREPLLELLRNEQQLREGATPVEGYELDGGGTTVQSALTSVFSADTGRTLDVTFTIADAVDAQLRIDGIEGGLEAASEDQVKVAVSHALAEGSPFNWIRDVLAADRTVEPRTVAGEAIDYWVAPASIINVYADNDTLGGGGNTVVLGTDDTTKEQFARDVLELLQGDQQSYRLWGIAIDVNLTSEEQGLTAGPFIMMTIIAVLLVVAFVMRSYWAVAIVGAALASLMVWLRGVSNLIGLESSLLLDLIVPIAMISFGVDFAFHAVGRYREQRLAGHTPRPALVTGLAGVLGALLLAFLTDSVAFLSNTISGIPQVIQFGVGATIALFAAFVALGIIVPTALALIEERLGVGHGLGRRGWVEAVAAAIVAGIVVLMLIVAPPFGVVALLLYGALLIGLPLWLTTRHTDADAAWEEITHDGGSRSRFADLTGQVILTFTRYRYVLLPVVAVLTIGCGYLANRVEAAFDVKDFFSSNSDFVVALDSVDEHFTETGGEPAVVYIEGALDSPEAIATIDAFIQAVDNLQSERFARSVEGDLLYTDTLGDMLRETMAEPVAIEAIESSEGVTLTDNNADGLPDTPEQIDAVFTYATANGIPYDEQNLRYSTDDVGLLLWTSEDGDRHATQITFQLPGTRNVENVGIALDQLNPLANQLEDDLDAIGADGYVSLTGGPFTRQESLDATFRALQRSVPIAVVLCLILSAIFMRSIRFGVVSTVPIVLVVAWLYAFMYLFDFNLNLVTATIGAVSVGVGVDYAIHYTMRFREEYHAGATRLDAVQRAASSTGNALLGSAASSVIGFVIMAFAPMPLFAAYGLLTAVMIVFAATAALVVLPPLLVVVTPEQQWVTLGDTQEDAAAGS